MGESSWPLISIEDATEAIIDYRGKTPEKTQSGVPLITAKVVKNGRIEEPDEFIAEADYIPWMRRGMPKPGDVLITTEAPLGEVAQLDGRRVALAQRLIGLRGRAGFLDNGFLKYTLMSQFVQDQLHSRASGSTVSGIKQSELRKVELPIPDFETQCRISGLLSALDDKIELNRRMNETLEAMARALFRSWFVDFDPVRAKSEGRPTGLPADLEALFPNEFEDSPLGEIPRGWRAGSVSDVAGIGRQQVNPGDAPDEVFAHFSIPAFDAGRNPILEVGFAIKSNKLVVTLGSILVSKLNPHIPRVWLTDVDPAYRAVGSTEFFVLQAKAPHSSAFLYSLMSSPEFAVDLQTLVTGTSNSHQRVQPEAFMSYSLVVPSDETATAFESLVKPLLDQVLANRKEMAQLAKTRDELLPKLLSEEIEVAEAEVKES
ncbi:MAG: restriction endonuclease subunit S [Methanoregulaceae archaeon]|nr:restriction endonuclease subunit S [Methanoregulaceae archaeon]